MLKYYSVLICILSVSLFARPADAWWNHFLFSQPALDALPELSSAPKVKVESLEDFLLKEQEGLIPLLEKFENDAKLELAKAGPQPEALRFQGGNAKTIRNHFLKAIRVNPRTPLGYFLQNIPGKPLPGKKSHPDTFSIYGESDPELNKDYEYYDIRIGDSVSPVDVLATATDEPDFGLDTNLFIDNGEPIGKEYGFGEQSFGDPKVYYSTQVPFHIGYYHESPIIFAAASFLTRTYPKYRIQQFSELSRFAFQTGHPYWGYRFLGWGTHYIADLSQPYHSRVLPNYGTLAMLWINIKAILGFETAKNQAIDRISSRHQTIEKYHFRTLRDAYKTGDLSHPFLIGLKQADLDKSYGSFDGNYITDVLTKESYDLSDSLDTFIEESHLLDANPEKQTELIHAGPLTELNSLLAKEMKGTGSHIRNYVRSVLK